MSVRTFASHAARLLVVTCFLTWSIGSVFAVVDTSDLSVITTHDNLKSGGQIKDGVLTIHLEIKEGVWNPNADGSPGIPTLAIAEEGGPGSIPGPMIRVPEGTRIHAFFKNTRIFPVVLHGFHTRPADSNDTVTVDPGVTKELNFLAGTPGTYFYNVTCFAPVAIDALSTSDTTMTGAFIVDGGGAPTDDRVLVIGVWYNWLVPMDFSHGFHEILTVNGKSWPNTTRLSYAVGETAHWRVINASVAIHPMHLHGAHFRVDSAGNEEREATYSSEQQRLAVTELMQPGRTMLVSWKPTHSGNWIFHCHLAMHFDPALATVAADVMGAGTDSEHHHPGGMAGLIVGIEVHPREGEAAEARPQPPQRHLTLTLSQNPPPANSTRRCINVELRDGAVVSATRHGSELGPPIILYRGQPTEITVVNNLESSTAIHWHGIELESYYDGVPGYGGDSRQVTPPIARGESFIAHMTPPRAGTYIYHTHWHDVGQLTTGLYGPLIVLEPGEKYDPEHDRVFVVSRAGPDLFKDAMLLNGSTQPAATPLRVGEQYRFRFINITPSDDEVAFSLLDAGQLASWMPVAKDGADLPEFYRKSCHAKQKFGAGETYDFEFRPEKPGNLSLETEFITLKTVLPMDVVGTRELSRK
jgi:FtsP/CotA-like multicopper oxidase with cupredoxin domain